jgi:hypothetical protein
MDGVDMVRGLSVRARLRVDGLDWEVSLDEEEGGSVDLWGRGGRFFWSSSGRTSSILSSEG